MSRTNLFEDVQNSLNIENVVNHYGIDFKKCGSSYKALCPFHDERTPSFTIFPKTNTYKCFGCGKGGNVITFVANLYNISNFEALKKINSDFNLNLDINKPHDSSLSIKNAEDIKLLDSFKKDANKVFITLAEYNRLLLYKLSQCNVDFNLNTNADVYFNLLKEQQYIESLVDLFIDCNLDELNSYYIAPIKMAIDYYRKEERKINEQIRMYSGIKKPELRK